MGELQNGGAAFDFSMRDSFALHDFFTVGIALLALMLSIYSLWKSRNAKRAKLINAAYYHVTLAVSMLEEMGEGFEVARKKIADNKSYTPHITRSAIDDLTYDHVIELMEWLDDQKQEKAISDYFHAQSAMHGMAGSFDLVMTTGNFSEEQKLTLLDLFQKTREQTLASARESARILAVMKAETGIRRLLRRMRFSWFHATK